VSDILSVEYERFVLCSAVDMVNRDLKMSEM
jgi:hypothetical protein